MANVLEVNTLWQTIPALVVAILFKHEYLMVCLATLGRENQPFFVSTALPCPRGLHQPSARRETHETS